MASIKQLKSKDRAHDLSWLDAGSKMYALRKEAFASLPPAKVDKPVRYLKRRFEEALKVWDREVRIAIERGQQVAGGNEVQIQFPLFERNLWLCAKAAHGSPVAQALAR